MLKDMRQLVVLVALAAGLTSTAGAQPPSPLACPLDSGLREIQESCAAGAETPDPATCDALRVLELLAGKDREAAAKVLTEIGFAKASIQRMMPYLELLALGAVGFDGPPECVQMLAQNIFGLDGLQESMESPESMVILARLLGGSEEAIGKLEEKHLDPAAARVLNTFSRAVRELLQSTELGWALIGGKTSNPMFDVMFGRGSILEEARNAVSEARESDSPEHKTKLLVRAGLSFVSAGLDEEGLTALLEADELLTQRSDEESKVLLAMTRWLLALAYDDLGMKDRKERVTASTDLLAEGTTREFLDAWGRTIKDHDFTALSRVMKKLFSGGYKKEELEPFLNAFCGVFPGMEPGPDDPSQPAGDLTHGANPYSSMMGVAELVMLKRYDEAAATTEELLAHYPRYNYVYLLVLIAAKQWLDGDRAGATRNCRKAIDALETKVEIFRVDDLQTAFIASKVYLVFLLAVELSAQEGRVEEAFAYAERGRAWTLRRLLGGPRSGPGTVDVEAAVHDRQLLEAIHQQERAGAQTEKLTRLRDEFLVQRLERKLAAAGENPLAQVEPVTLERLQHEVLDPKTTLLVYAVGLEGHLWAWVIRRESVEMVLLETPKKYRILDLNRALRTRSFRPSPLADGESEEVLYRQLIEPLAQHLGDSTSLIVVPYGVLHHLPFAALRNPKTGRYLVQDFTLSLAPSASALELLLRPEKSAGSDGVLVLGDPVLEKDFELEPLAGARQEATTVSQLLGTEPLLGADATETEVRARAAGLGLLHLAAHGEYTPSSPIFSRLWLSRDARNDGMLEAHEVWDYLDLGNARLVTLSGCETALGTVTTGDEIVGLTQAFLVAGSRAVLSTLWAVDDEASEKLVVAFYRRLLKGSPAAQALAEAQRELIDDPDYAEPFFWAGFTLTGDPSVRWKTPWWSLRPSLLAAILAVAGAVILGFVLPARFPNRLGIVFAPKADMSGGSFCFLRSQRGTAGGFFRPARVYVSADGLKDRPSGALARLRAGHGGARLRPLPGRSLWRQSADGEWHQVPERGHPAPVGAIYRDESGSVYFQLRRG